MQITERPRVSSLLKGCQHLYVAGNTLSHAAPPTATHSYFALLAGPGAVRSRPFSRRSMQKLSWFGAAGVLWKPHAPWRGRLIEHLSGLVYFFGWPGSW